MNIEGLDYNTQREKLVMPEYGREIQKMVDLAVRARTRSCWTARTTNRHFGITYT